MLFPQEGFNNRERGVRPYVGLQKDITRKDVSFDPVMDMDVFPF